MRARWIVLMLLPLLATAGRASEPPLSEPPLSERPSRCRLDVDVHLENGDRAPAGLQLAAVSDSARETLRGMTDGSGAPIHFESVPCGEILVVHLNPGTPLLAERRRTWLRPGEVGVIEFPVEALTLMTVTATDLEGRPVEGVFLSPQRLLGPGESRWWGFAVDGGAGQVHYFMRPGRHELGSPHRKRVVEVTVDGRRARFPLRIDVGDRDEESRSIVIRVMASHEIAGVITGDAARSHHHVDLYGGTPGFNGRGRSSYQAFTDEDRRFRMQVDRFPVEIVPLADNLRFEPSSVIVTEPGDPIEFAAVVDDRPTRLHGRVVNATDGTAIPGAMIQIRSECVAAELPAGSVFSPVRARLASGKDGRFSVPCNPDCSFSGSVAADGFNVVTSLRGEAGSCSTPVVVPLDPAVDLRIEVVDTEGRPVPDLPLDFPSVGISTDVDGVAHMSGVAPGHKRVQVSKLRRATEHRWLTLVADSGEGYGKQPMFDLRPGERRVVRLIAVEGGEVCTSVAGDAGETVRLNEVRLHDPDGALLLRHGANHARQSTDAACTTPVPPGRYRVRVAGPRFATAWWPGAKDDGDDTVEVSPGVQTRLEPITVRPGGNIVIFAEDWPADVELPHVELATAQSSPDPARAVATETGIRQPPVGEWQAVLDQDVRCERRTDQASPSTGIRCIARGVPVGEWRCRLSADWHDRPVVVEAQDAVIVTRGGYPEVSLGRPIQPGGG